MPAITALSFLGYQIRNLNTTKKLHEILKFDDEGDYGYLFEMDLQLHIQENYMQQWLTFRLSQSDFVTEDIRVCFLHSWNPTMLLFVIRGDSNQYDAS